MAFDTKKFIKEIEKKGVLWKAPTSTQGKILEFKQKAWEEIGQSMFSNWNVSNQATKEARIQEMRVLWKNIENKFYHDYKNGLLEGKKGRRYKDILSFLLLAGGDRQMELSKKGKEKNDRSRQDKTKESPPKKIKIHTKKPEKVIELLPVMSPSGDLKDLDDNEDTSFFKSMLPTLKKFNDQQRLDFRLEVLNILKKVRDTNRVSRTSPIPMNRPKQ